MVLRQIQRQPEWVSSIRDFPFVEHPGAERLEKALQMLFHFRALTSIDSSELTEQGMAMAQMSASPRAAAILFEAQRLRVLDLASVALGMTQLTGFLFRRGRSEEEKEAVLKNRQGFAERLPTLGDVGAAVAVWMDSNEQMGQMGQERQGLRSWCFEHSVNFQSLREGRGLASSMFQEMQSMQGSRSAERPEAEGDDEMNETGSALGSLESLTSDSFRDEGRVSLLLQALLAGFFGNLAFYLPPRPGDAQALPTYYIPQNSQVGRLQVASAFRLSMSYPQVAFFMEIQDSGYVSITNLCGVKEGFERQLPASYRTSPQLEDFLSAARHRQRMSYPSVVKVDCPLALRRFTGPRGQKLAALQEEFKEDFLEEEEDLILEVDQRAQMVLVMCSNEETREEIALNVETQVKSIATQLEKRRKEWPIPGTGARAVVGTGGVCHEILLSSGQSISVVFNTSNAADRLSEPIKTLRKIPPGFFADLASTKMQPVADMTAARVIPTWAQFEQKARNYNKRITDLADMPLACTVAVIEYTAGGLCYRCNPFLRACQEARCREYAPYLHALQNFVRKRSLHPLNAGVKVVYRGCSVPRDSAAEYVVGESVIWPAFTSTSTSKHVAQGFAAATATSGSETFLFEITIPYCCPVDDVSVYPGEAEILLPAFSVMKVVGMSPLSRGIREVQLRYLPFAAQDLVAKSEEHEDPDGEVPTETGPVIIPVKSRLKGEAGIAEELERQLSRFDAGVDADVRWDSQQKRVWGRASFQTTEAASRACAMLQGSIIGDRLITMRPSPVQTGGLALQCRVRARLTGVQHKGTAVVDCGSEEVIAEMLGSPATENFRVPLELVLPGKDPFTVQVQPFRKGGKGGKGKGDKGGGMGEVEPTTLHLAGVPGHMTQWQLQMALANKTSQKLLADAVRPLQRDKALAEEEAKHLRSQGGTVRWGYASYASYAALPGVLPVACVVFHQSRV